MARQVVIVFDREEDLIGATNAAREQGIPIADAYTPYPVHGMDRAMGLAPSRLPWACFLLGALGASSILLFQIWASARDWPINVGGRPWNSTPAFIPATFEMAVLFGGVGTVLVFLAIAGLRPGREANVPALRVTDDQFALVLGGPVGTGVGTDAVTVDRAATEAVVSRFHPVSIEEREVELHDVTSDVISKVAPS